MIYTRLHGFLGNQMFQYAAAAQLAARLGVSVALDDRRARANGQGNLCDVFDLPVVPPAHLPPDQDKRRLSYLLWRTLGRRPVLHRERDLGYDPAFERWGDESYLHGYWQSEKYFADQVEHLRSVFQFTPDMSPENEDMAARIKDAQAVSLHVRRGDYVGIGAAAVCDQAYYDAALDRVTAELSGSPHVFVFSDDPAWARDNLNVPFEKTVVDLNGRDAAHCDMHLMSLCQHNVIANSTFSWWGAWLNANPGKRVAAPVKWFGNDHQHNPDIIPESWIRVQG